MELSVIEITPLETKFMRLRLIMNIWRSNNVGVLFVYVLTAPFFIIAFMILMPGGGGWPFYGSSRLRYSYPLVGVLGVGIFVAIVHFITMLALKLSRRFYVIFTAFVAAWTLLALTLMMIGFGSGDGDNATTPSHLVGEMPMALFMVLLGAFVAISGVTAVLLSTRERQLFSDLFLRRNYFAQALDYFGIPPDARIKPSARAGVYALIGSAGALMGLGFVLAITIIPMAVIRLVSRGVDAAIYDAHFQTGGTDLISAGIAVISVLCLFIGRTLLNQGRRLVVVSLHEATKSDPRPPILFLRSFRDEQVYVTGLGASFQHWLDSVTSTDGNVDQILTREGSQLGPVVALGRPSDPLPPYGAARGYVANSQWKEFVEQLITSSRAIVMISDATEGVAWEIERIFALGAHRKVLFMLPGGLTSQAARHCRQAVKSRFPDLEVELELRSGQQADRHKRTIIAVEFLDDGVATIYESARETRVTYDLLLRMFFRERINALEM